METAIISLGELRVGFLSRINEDEDFVFRFDEGYCGTSLRPVLGQAFEDCIPGDLVASGLPAWFANLLPQGTARKLLERWSALGEESSDNFAFLLAIGSDLPGAVEVRPAEMSLDGLPLYKRVNIGRAPDDPLFAIAGAQPKLSVHSDEGGLSIPARGESGEYIAKFRDPRYADLPRLEYATTAWARDAGIATHDFRLANTEDFAVLPDELRVKGSQDVFLAERFDRSHGQKIHVEDYCQIMGLEPGHPSQYRPTTRQLATLTSVLCPREDLFEMIRRIVFVLFCGNGDAHAKNWGVIYHDGRNPTLSPAYDLIATRTRIPSDDLALSIAGIRDFYAVTRAAIRDEFRELGLDSTEVDRTVRDVTDRVTDSWFKSEIREQYSKSEQVSIQDHMHVLKSSFK